MVDALFTFAAGSFYALAAVMVVASAILCWVILCLMIWSVIRDPCFAVVKAVRARGHRHE